MTTLRTVLDQADLNAEQETTLAQLYSRYTNQPIPNGSIPEGGLDVSKLDITTNKDNIDAFKTIIAENTVLAKQFQTALDMFTPVASGDPYPVMTNIRISPTAEVLATNTAVAIPATSGNLDSEGAKQYVITTEEMAAYTNGNTTQASGEILILSVANFLVENIDAEVTPMVADGDGINPWWIAVGAGGGLLVGGFIVHRFVTPKARSSARTRGQAEGRTAGEAARQGEVDVANSARMTAEAQLAALRTPAAELQTARGELTRIESEFQRRVAAGESEATLQAELGPGHTIALGNVEARLAALEAALAGTPAPMGAPLAALPLPAPLPVSGAPVDALITLEPQVRALETRLGITTPVGDMNARLAAIQTRVLGVIQTRVDAEVAARAAAEAHAAGTSGGTAATDADIAALRQLPTALEHLRNVEGDLRAQTEAYRANTPNTQDTHGRYTAGNLEDTHTAFEFGRSLETKKAELRGLESKLGERSSSRPSDGSLYGELKQIEARLRQLGSQSMTPDNLVEIGSLQARKTELTTKVIPQYEAQKTVLAQEVRILELEARQAALPGEITALETQIDNVRYELGVSFKADPTGARSPSPGVDVTAKRTELAGLVGRLRGLQSELSSGATELARLKAAGTP